MAKKQSDELRLLARDEEDLSVLRATLQDAILHVGDMAFLPKRRQFAAVMNRFCWECADDGKSSGRAQPDYRRVRSGLHFSGVLSVQSRKINLKRKEGVLELLTIEFEQVRDGEIITLIFAGGGQIRLKVECIEASLTDISGPWSTANRPEHRE